VPERGEQNQVIGWIASIIDITERKQAMETKEQFEALAAEMGIGTWNWDSRRDSLTWTPQIAAIYGLEPSSVKSYADFRNRVHPDDIHDVEARGYASVKARETFQLEFRIIRPDGRLRWVMAVGRAVYDTATGEPIRIIGNCIDITGRKAADAQAELQRKELAHLMRVATLGGLSGGIAHELAQPLAAILTNAQAAQAMLAKKDLNREDIANTLEDIVGDDIRAS
jgi:PAS domain S-box-containing protein